MVLTIACFGLLILIYGLFGAISELKKFQRTLQTFNQQNKDF